MILLEYPYLAYQMLLMGKCTRFGKCFEYLPNSPTKEELQAMVVDNQLDFQSSANQILQTNIAFWLKKIPGDGKANAEQLAASSS